MSRARRRPLPAKNNQVGPPAPSSTQSLSEDAGGVTVKLSTPSGALHEFQSVRLGQIALKWAYFVGNRRRWVAGGVDREEQSRRCAKELEQLGINPTMLENLAHAGLVQVSIPYVTEEQGWEARIFPWEYMLTAATKPVRADRPLTVFRHLYKQGVIAPVSPRVPRQLMFIQSAPGELADIYTYESERLLIESSVSLTDPRPIFLPNPTTGRLQNACSKHNPDIVHLTGVDTHEGADYLKLERGRDLNDGIFMSGQNDSASRVDAWNLAQLLTAGNPKPMVVTFNLYNSAARIAALTVASGAEAAIGFQDTFDEELTDLLYAAFYHTLKESSWDILRSFQEALLVIPSASQFGSGVVLWSAADLLVPQPGTVRRSRRLSPDEPPDELESKLNSEKNQPLNVSQVQDATTVTATVPAPAAGTGDGSLRQWVKVVHDHEDETRVPGGSPR